MTIHRQANLLLYDYVNKKTSDAERALVEKHLVLCKQCMEDVEEIRSVIQLMSQKNAVPSDERPAEYWQRFAKSVDERLTVTGSSAALFWSNIWDDIISFVLFHPVAVSAMSGVAALFVVAVLLWQKDTPLHHESENLLQVPVENVGQPAGDNIRMANYFRKSQMLLVGITNMKLGEDQQVDLSSERKYSRALLQEARYLKNQPMDNRSAKLIGDLEKILIQLANAKDHGDAPDVEIIRGGIHQENLLFKIRVAESMFDSSRTHEY